MGKAIQVGVHVGTLKSFNIFLAHRQELGDTYVESRPLDSKRFYFALMMNVNLDLPIEADDLEPKQLDGEVEL